MQRYEHSREEQLMFFFQRQRKSIDDRAKDLEEFSNTVEALGLVDELEEDIVDGAADVRAEVEELAIDTVQGGF